LVIDKPRIVVPASFRSSSEFFEARFLDGKVVIKPVDRPKGRRIARNLWEWRDCLHLQTG